MISFSRTTMKAGSATVITKPLCSIFILSSPKYAGPFFRGLSKTITTTTNITRTSNVGNKNDKDNNGTFLVSATEVVQDSTHISKSVYVHPLSQIVLEHLQKSHSDWVSKVGLDAKGGFSLKDDGTFVLYFPPVPSAHGHPSTHNTSNATANQGKIWTTYDPNEKKHWLKVERKGVIGHYMLQDNKKPAWHGSKLSTYEKVQVAVDEMISKLENL